MRFWRCPDGTGVRYDRVNDARLDHEWSVPSELPMLRGSLVWKLTIWFLLLSLLPIGVIVLFVRQDVSEELTNLAKEDTGSQVSLLANEISSAIDDRRLQELIGGATNETQVAFLVGEDGAYVAHGDEAGFGGLMSDDFSAEVVRHVLDGTDGVVVEEGTGRFVGFSTVPAGALGRRTLFGLLPIKAVLAMDESVVSAPMSRIERSAIVQLVVTLLVISMAIGVAVWVVVRPIQRLTSAAQEVGAGNLDVQIDPANMKGELKVLTNAFNQMTRQVAGRTRELEELGRAILNGPPDASTLSEVLGEHVSLMFPHSQLEIRVFPDQTLLRHPDDRQPVAGSAWEWLATQSEAQHFLPGEVPPWDTQAADDALVVTPVLDVETKEPIGGIHLSLPATLARHLGLRELVDHHLDLGGAPGRANTGDKMLTLVASALAGGDCIDDADALRAGGTVGVLGCVVKAPSTLGTFLRSFRWGHVRQLDRVSRQLLARAWAAGAGPGDSSLTIDLDSTICETYGLAKEGARHHGYTGAGGYHPLLAIAAGTGEVLMSRLREGRANTARGAAHFLRETVGRVRYGGARGQLTVRADSGFYAHTVVAACREMDVRFSITIRQRASLRDLIEAIPEEDWTPIPYWMDGAADVAETTYTPFQTKPDAAPVRLIVRRVKPTPGSQLALFARYSYHAFITDRDGETLELEADHRRHAEVENAIRDLKYGVGLNHMPSARFAANGAWLAGQVMAHNLARWTARIGLGERTVITKTLRRRVFALVGRITRSARRLTLHLPRRWPWETQFSRALARLQAIPFPA